MLAMLQWTIQSSTNRTQPCFWGTPRRHVTLCRPKFENPIRSEFGRSSQCLQLREQRIYRFINSCIDEQSSQGPKEASQNNGDFQDQQPLILQKHWEFSSPTCLSLPWTKSRSICQQWTSSLTVGAVPLDFAAPFR